MMKAEHRSITNSRSALGGDARPVTHLYKAAKCYMEAGCGDGGDY